MTNRAVKIGPRDRRPTPITYVVVVVLQHMPAFPLLYLGNERLERTMKVVIYIVKTKTSGVDTWCTNKFNVLYWRCIGQGTVAEREISPDHTVKYYKCGSL